MQTVFIFLKALLISWSIVYAAYGVMLLTVPCVMRVVFAIRWLGDEAYRRIRTSSNILAAPADGVATMAVFALETPPPSLRDMTIFVRQAREVLAKHERQAFCSLSEMRETAKRTQKVIAEAQQLILQAEAISKEACYRPHRRFH